MSRKTDKFDEYLLAAYMSGDVPDSLRKEISIYLNRHRGARELLGMATEALEVAESGDGASFANYSRSVEPSGRIGYTASDFIPSTTIWKSITAVALAVTVLAISLFVHVYQERKEPATGIPAQTNTFWTPRVLVSQFGLNWRSIPGAERYRVHIQARTSGRELFMFETSSTSMSGGDFAALQGGHVEAWIEALDKDESTIRISGRSDILIVRE